MSRLPYVLICAVFLVSCLYSTSSYAQEETQEEQTSPKRYHLNIYDCMPGAWEGWQLKYNLKELSNLYPGLLCPDKEGYHFLEEPGQPYFAKIQYISPAYLINELLGYNKYRIAPALNNAEDDGLMRYIIEKEKIGKGTYFFSRHNGFKHKHPFTTSIHNAEFTTELDNYFFQIDDDSWSIGIPAAKCEYGIHVYKCSPKIWLEENILPAMKFGWYVENEEDMKFHPVPKNQPFFFTGGCGTYVLFTSFGRYLLFSLENNTTDTQDSVNDVNTHH